MSKKVLELSTISGNSYRVGEAETVAIKINNDGSAVVTKIKVVNDICVKQNVTIPPHAVSEQIGFADFVTEDLEE